MDKILTGSVDPVDDIDPITHSNASKHDHILTSSDVRHMVDIVDDKEVDLTSFGDDKIGPGIEGILRQDLLQSMGTHPLASLIGSGIGVKKQLEMGTEQLSLGVNVLLVILAVVSSLLDINVWIVEASIALIVTLVSSPLTGNSNGKKFNMKDVADGCITTFFVYILVQAFKIHFDVKIFDNVS